MLARRLFEVNHSERPVGSIFRRQSGSLSWTKWILAVSRPSPFVSLAATTLVNASIGIQAGAIAIALVWIILHFSATVDLRHRNVRSVLLVIAPPGQRL